MELTEEQLTTVLQEAFTCYLAFLAHCQRVRESSLPHSGKGVETSSDVSSQQDFQNRVAGTETCLQYTDKIARRVLRWSDDPEYFQGDDAPLIEPQVQRFEAFLEDEAPFLDHFTGAWIQPKTPFSAGPSDKDGGAANKSFEYSAQQTEPAPKSPVVEETEKRTPEVKQIRPIFRTSTRPFLGLHPNVSISLSTISIDQTPPPKPTFTQSTTLNTESPSASEDESDSEEESSDESDQETTKLIGQRAEEVSELESSEESEDDSEDDSESDDDGHTSITSAMASAFYLQKSTKDAKSQKLQAEEKLRKENIQRSQQQAQRLAEEWARKEKVRLDAQQAYAQKLEREEKARVEQIKRDRAAAQRAQERWEAAEALRAHERRRREAEAKRPVEEPRSRRSESRHAKEREVRHAEPPRARDRSSRVDERPHGEVRLTHRHREMEHERRHSPVRRPSPPRKADSPPKKTRFSDREPSKRRSSSTAPARRSESTVRVEPPRRVSPTRRAIPVLLPKVDLPSRASPTRRAVSVPAPKVDALRKPSPPRKVEIAKKPDSPKQVDCVSCMELGDKRDMTVLECKHAYCPDCIKEAFKTALKSHALFKCCGKTIPATSVRSLSSSFTQKYALLAQELSTPNPKFCSLPSCSLFLPPSSIHGPLGTCASCKTRTCIPCGKAEHSGVCKQDKEGKKLEDLAKKRGWKQCPNCSQILERTYGCLHMTCRCGANWCYACLRDWDVCGSSCSRGEPNGGYAIPPMDDNPWLRWADFPPHPANAGDLGGRRARDDGARAAPRQTALNLGAALADRMGANVQYQHDRNTGNTRVRGEGAGSVLPVIATAVLMALMRD